MLDLVKNFLVFGDCIKFAIIIDLLPFNGQILLSGTNLFLEPTFKVLLLAIIYDIDCIIDNILLFLELAWMDNDQVLVQVELAHIV